MERTIIPIPVMGVNIKYSKNMIKAIKQNMIKPIGGSLGNRGFIDYMFSIDSYRLCSILCSTPIYPDI